MKNSDMSNYMRLEMWMDRVQDTIASWEKIQGVEVPKAVRKTILKFMKAKIKRGIDRGSLMKVFFQIAVTSLIYIKMKRLDK